jgi:hypothetical protein
MKKYGERRYSSTNFDLGTRARKELVITIFPEESEVCVEQHNKLHKLKCCTQHFVFSQGAEFLISRG